MEEKTLVRDEVTKIEQEIKDLEAKLAEKKDAFIQAKKVLSEQEFKKALGEFLEEFNLKTAHDIARASEILRAAKDVARRDGKVEARPGFKKPFIKPIPTNPAPKATVSDDYIADDEAVEEQPAPTPDHDNTNEVESKTTSEEANPEQAASDNAFRDEESAEAEDQMDRADDGETGGPDAAETDGVSEDSVPVGEDAAEAGLGDGSEEAAEAVEDEPEEIKMIDSEILFDEAEDVTGEAPAEEETAKVYDKTEESDTDSEADNAGADGEEGFDWKAFDNLW